VKPIAVDSMRLGSGAASVLFLHGALDPASAGQAAPLGSFFVNTLTGEWFRKLIDADDFAWEVYGGNIAGSTGWFGSGLDGDVTMPVGTTQIARTMYYDDLVIPSGAIVEPNGFGLYVRGTLTIEAGGVLRANGAAASGQTGGAAATSTGPYGIGTAGANGGASAAGSNATSASGRPPYLPSTGATSGAGGAGGAAAAAGGNGGGQTAWSSAEALNLATPMMVFGGPSASTSVGGGAGGGGGSGGGVGFPGGGGGGGAGPMGIWARYVENAGTISANGGAGAAPPSGGNAGGGGGGGGGRIWLVTARLTGNAMSVAGGAGGAGAGTGAAGTAGSTGYTWTFPP
jgi:hypothetical protein